ncbi:hypothetical protein X975_17344, partial [Stegodyphus mimosarum]
MLVYKNYPFVLHARNEDKSYWRCADSRKNKCIARCHTLKDTLLKEIGYHNHHSRKELVLLHPFNVHNYT